MGVYAQSLKVNDALEALAHWVTWADQKHYAQDDAAALYNLNQFWAAKDALDSATAAQYQNDVVYLDALSHRVSGYIYMRKMVQADPSTISSLTDLMAEQFSLSSSEFEASGHAMAAADDALRAQQAQTDAAQTAAGYVDDSLVTAVKDRYNTVLDQAGSLITSAGSVLSFLSNPWVLGGIVVVGALLFMRGRK